MYALSTELAISGPQILQHCHNCVRAEYVLILTRMILSFLKMIIGDHIIIFSAILRQTLKQNATECFTLHRSVGEVVKYIAIDAGSWRFAYWAGQTRHSVAEGLPTLRSFFLSYTAKAFGHGDARRHSLYASA